MKNLLTIAELARYLRLDSQTVSRKAQRGEIPGFKIGNRWRFRKEEIDEWLASPKKKLLAHRDKNGNLLEKLKKFAAKEDRILLGYLFGSTARGRTRSDSDIDVAFLLKGNPTVEDKISLTSDLTELLSTENIDVVLLNEATPLLRHEIITDGKLFFSHSEEIAGQFEMKVYREYLDTDYLRKVQNGYLMESILGDQA
ncbi:MAG: helix-turn-helix domain-containing protein [Deltaproteobacteria bacterium]|nr:helix-turn-helix domain-containing protein [Deltaproteobacteria bacterium]